MPAIVPVQSHFVSVLRVKRPLMSNVTGVSGSQKSIQTIQVARLVHLHHMLFQNVMPK